MRLVRHILNNLNNKPELSWPFFVVGVDPLLTTATSFLLLSVWAEMVFGAESGFLATVWTASTGLTCGFLAVPLFAVLLAFVARCASYEMCSSSNDKRLKEIFQKIED